LKADEEQSNPEGSGGSFMRDPANTRGEVPFSGPYLSIRAVSL